MGRIHKYSGKRLDNGEWVYGSLIMGTATNEKNKEGFPVAFIVPSLPCASEPGDLWTARMYRVDPASIGEFTGCLDKHGHEVYEGDLVDAWSAGSHVTNGLVRFGSTDFFILLNGENGPHGRWNLCPSYGPIGRWNLAQNKHKGIDEHLEVVGNVIDNEDMVAGYLKWCREENKDWND